MAADEGNVIIIGKLDDTALKKSIDDLVKTIGDKTKEMAKSFDTAISDMVASLGKLGTATASIENQSGKRTSATKKEAEAVTETAGTYDKLAQAQQKITKDSQLETYQRYISVIRKMIERWHLQLKDISQQKFVPTEQMDKLKSSIESTEQKLAQLNKRLQYERAHGQHDPAKGIYSPALARVTQEIEVQQDRLRKLQEELNRVGTAGKEAFNAEKQAQIQAIGNKIDAAKAKIKEYSAIIFGLMQTSFQPLSGEIEKAKQKEQELAQATKEAAQNAQQHTEEIRKQAKAIRESKEFQERGLVTIPSKYQTTNYTVLKSSELSVEEQLLNIMKQEEQLAKSFYSVTEKTTQQKEQQVNLTRTQQEIYNRGVTAQQDWLGGKIDLNSFDRLKQAMRDLNNAYEIMRQNGRGETAEAQRFKQSAIEVSNAINKLTQTGANAKKEYKTLRDVVAELLNIQSDEVVMVNSDTASYKRLQTMLKQLQEAYSRMNAEQRNGDWGNAIKATIAELEVAIRKLKGEMARPLSLKQIMGLDEKTIDDISYKIQQLTAYRSNLNIDTQYGEIRKVNAEIQRLQKTQQDAMATNNRYARSNDALSRSFAYIRNRLAFYMSVSATTGFVKQIIEIRGQYEALERSISVLTDSMQRGHEIFNQLNQMAMNSPFTTIELGEAARQLVAYGVAAEDVVDTTRRLADISAAVGQPVDRLTYALGQIQTYGYLTSIQAKTFMRAGVPLVKELADRYSELEGRVVSTGEVYDRMKHKAVSYADVVSVINKQTDEGGRFFNYQAKMADTLKIQLANLSLAWNTMLNDIGKSNQSLIAAPIKGLKMLFANWKTLDRVIKTLLGTFVLFKGVQAIVLLQAGKLSTMMGWQALLGKKLAFTFRSLGVAMKAAFLSPTTWIVALTAMLIDLFAQWGANKDAVREMNQEIKNMANESAKALDDFLAKNNELENSLYKRNDKGEIVGKVDLKEDEARTAWESIREEISNSSNASDMFIAQLMRIEDINERVRKGFEYARNIRDAKGVLAELGEEAIKVEKDFGWWGMFGEGLKSDAADYIKQLDEIIKRYGSIAELERRIEEQRNNSKGGYATYDEHLEYEYKSALSEFQNEVRTTTNSIVDILDSTTIDLSSKIFNEEDFQKQMQRAIEIVDSVSKTVIEKENMSSREAFEFRRELDNQIRSIYENRIKAEIQLHSGAEQEKYKKALNMFNETYYSNRIAFQRFTEWIKTTHKVALDDMYNAWTANGTKGINFMDEKVRKQFYDWLESFKQNNQTAYNDLKNWVNLANLLTVNIGVLFDTSGGTSKTVLEGLKEADQAADQAFQDIQRLTLRMADLEKEGKKNTKEYAKAQDELTAAQKRYNDAVAAGGKSKKEDTANAKAERERLNAAKKAENERKREEKKRLAEQKRQEAARRREQKRQESELAKALKDEISLVERLRSEYDKLRKAGIKSETITKTLSQIANPSLERINKVLKSYGVPTENALKLSDFFDADKGVIKYKDLYNYFDKQVNTLKATGRAIDEDYKVLVEEMIKLLTDSLVQISDDIDTELEKGLNKNLEAYELALDVEQDPELMNAIASAFGLNLEELLTDANAPRTLEQYVDKVNWWLNQAIQKKLNLQALESLSMTKTSGDKNGASYDLSDVTIANGRQYSILKEDDLKELRRIIGEEDDVVKEFENRRKDALSRMRKDFSNTLSEWNKLIDKYGDFQTKLIKITKDSADEVYGVIKKFANKDDDRLMAMNLAEKIKISSDPEEVNRLYNELTDLMQRVVGKNQKGLDIINAILNKRRELISKAEWENFKDSDLYSATFEDLERVGNITLEMLLTQLDQLKDKVKDSPEAMKALMDAYKKIREELEGRRPFETMASSAKDLLNATIDLRKARKEYKAAQKALKDLQDQANNNAESDDIWTSTYKKAAEDAGMSAEEINQALETTADGEKKAVVSAEDLANAEERAKQAAENYRKAQDKQRGAWKKFVNSANDAKQAIEEIGGVFGTIKELFGFADDSDAGIGLDALQSGFQGVATALGLVITISQLAQMSLGWVAVVGMALAALIASLNFIANASDNRISKKVAASERQVKKLQNTLKELEDTADDAYGAITIGAQNAIRANKELQLVELKRQLQLEQSRKKKKQDKDKIIDLKGQIIDLRNEIDNASEDVVNDLLGISGAGSWAEDLVQSMIDAFRDGEDAMEKFSEKWDEMIDNMIMKYIVSTVMQKWWDNVLKGVENIEEQFTADIAREKAEAQNVYDEIQGTSTRDIKKQMIASGYTNDFIDKYGDMVWMKWSLITEEEAKAWQETQLQAQQQTIDTIDERLNQASIDATKASIDYMYGRKGEGESIAQQVKDTFSQYWTFGENSDKSLSQLQQGIQGITEDTAGALEAYMNGVSQQVYLQSDLMTQIRDAVVGYDPVLSMGLQSQMLLELQNSYQIQVAIQNILIGWSNPSGNAVQVSLI